jgi:uncharacterized protein (UPF0332 family)
MTDSDNQQHEELPALHLRFLNHAGSLLHTARVSGDQIDDIEVRRVISASYYAAFHSICFAIAERFSPAVECNADIGRLPAHKDVVAAATDLSNCRNCWVEPIPDEARLLGQYVRELYSTRLRADYSADSVFPLLDAERSHQMAEYVVETMNRLHGLHPNALQAFLLCCLGLKKKNR